MTENEKQLLAALEQISSLWPEPPNCADIMSVSGINDGKSRAIIADAAIKIARAAIDKHALGQGEPLRYSNTFPEGR